MFLGDFTTNLYSNPQIAIFFPYRSKSEKIPAISMFGS